MQNLILSDCGVTTIIPYVHKCKFYHKKNSQKNFYLAKNLRYFFFTLFCFVIPSPIQKGRFFDFWGGMTKENTVIVYYYQLLSGSIEENGE